MNGCCVDKSCTTVTCMNIPDGNECDDCAHWHKCLSMFGAEPGNTSCQFFPRKFRLTVKAVVFGPGDAD